ncbi:hypothetical protein FIBSPDRAFT_925553 [Athelia psychrophila]|uniref:Crossover junction endonuclease MUS81-like HHH domain-containing protein n=1 Tax=Athelia psychrophila TaxID=1759441 RepID=A0A166UHK5_9AGAM|nr:hypothetical protein FIBSPDRAFT_925553 [Fibularhizoctonia sp. CBS 109695]
MPKAAKCTNPLFLQWVKGFHAEKDYRIRGGPPRATGYEGAIAALEACTVRYEHPAEMKGKVRGVGPTTIERLEAELEKYCERKGIDMPELPVKVKKAVAKPKAAPKANMTKLKASTSKSEVLTEDPSPESVAATEDSAAPKAKATKPKASTSKAKVATRSSRSKLIAASTANADVDSD